MYPRLSFLLIDLEWLHRRQSSQGDIAFTDTAILVRV